MRLLWGFLFLVIPSFGFAQTTKTSPLTANQAPSKGMKWFSNLPSSAETTSRDANFLEENRQTIQYVMMSAPPGKDGLGTLASMRLKGSLDDQKQAVLSMLETTVARNSHAYDDLSKWAQSQGIRHPQDSQLRLLSQNMEGKMLDVRIQMAQSLPGPVKGEVISSALEEGLEVTHPQIISKIMEQKNVLSPKRYFSLLTNGLENVGHLYDGERDLPAIEKAIRELQSTPGVDQSALSCSLWRGFTQFDASPDPTEGEDNNLSISPEGKKLRGVLLKPLFEMQMKKTTCKEVQDLKPFIKAFEKQNALTPEDMRALSRIEKDGTSQENMASTFSADQCRLAEVQTAFTNFLRDLEKAKINEPTYFSSLTSKKCIIRILTTRKETGFQTQISLWNSNGQKLADFKKDPEKEEELSKYVAKGSFPILQKSKSSALVLTNLPPLQTPAKAAVGAR